MRSSNDPLDLYERGRTKFERRPGGAWIVDGVEVAHTHRCCHCGHHFLSVRGSGVVRGFCMACMHVTCGAPACDTCYPFEKRLDDAEKGGMVLR